jgi:hypothetical protein
VARGPAPSETAASALTKDFDSRQRWRDGQQLPDTKYRGPCHVPASESLEHVGSKPTRLRGIMPLMVKSSRRPVKLSGNYIEFVYAADSFSVNVIFGRPLHS